MVVGFVFGGGSLPRLLLEEKPHSICAILGDPPTNIHLAKKHQNFSIMQIPQMLDFFKANAVTHICLAGFVKKPNIDLQMLNIRLAPLLFRLICLSNKGDNSLLTTIISYIENKGFQVLAATEIIPSLLVKAGVLTNSRPDANHYKEISLACNFLHDISKYDISQACIVQNNTITALEGIEGTKNMISRMTTFNKNAILVKMPKAGQTLKADMPTIGLETIEDCVKANISGIAIKAEQTIVLNINEVIKTANENGIFIISIA
jgi:DUF1009 family protein